ncbi:hypothetical protein TrRE_jg8475, partial [Triparma retinervis]
MEHHGSLSSFWRVVVFFFLLFSDNVGSVDVVNMRQLLDSIDMNGSTKMTNGDTMNLISRSYQCSTDGTGVSCGQSFVMLVTQNLFGTIQCASDIAAPCVIDGQEQTQLVWFQGTGGSSLIVRALTFANGRYSRGGGINIDTATNIDFLICIFINNGATGSSGKGGAIYMSNSGGTVNFWGTSFSTNTAEAGASDIWNSRGTINIFDTCPSPYEANSPTVGLELVNDGVWDVFSYSDCTPFLCDSGSFNPTTSNVNTVCQTCEAGKNSPPGSSDCPDWCSPGEHCIVDMDALLNKCSNTGVNEGSQVMAGGDTTTLAEGDYYKCSLGTCASSGDIVSTTDLWGDDLVTSGLDGVANQHSYSECLSFDCDEGFYNPSFGSGSSSCVACKIGKYSSSRGATSESTCISCSAGKHSSSPGADSERACAPCDAGTYSSIKTIDESSYDSTGIGAILIACYLFCVVLFAAWAYHAMQDMNSSSEGLASKALKKSISKARKSAFSSQRLSTMFLRSSGESSSGWSRKTEDGVEMSPRKASSFNAENPLRNAGVSKVSFGAKVKIVREGNPQNIANTIWAMATLKCDAPVLAKAIDRKEVVEMLVREGNSQEIANTIWAMATLQHDAPVLAKAIDRKEVVERLAREGTLQNIANTMWSFGVLGLVRENEESVRLLWDDSMRRPLGNFGDEILQQLELTRLFAKSEGVELVADGAMREEMTRSARRVTIGSPSGFENHIAKELEKFGFGGFEREVSPFGGDEGGELLKIDIAWVDKKVALEL